MDATLQKITDFTCRLQYDDLTPLAIHECKRRFIDSIACVLGGADGRRLFMVSGRVRPAQASLADRAGQITWLDVDVPAAAAPQIRH